MLKIPVTLGQPCPRTDIIDKTWPRNTGNRQIMDIFSWNAEHHRQELLELLKITVCLYKVGTASTTFSTVLGLSILSTNYKPHCRIYIEYVDKLLP